MDRAHRLGQKRDVAVYRLITLQTLDMHLLKIADDKRRLERIVTHPQLRDLPFILETPNELPGYAAEIELLRKLAG